MEVDIEIQQTKKMNSRVDSLSQNSNNKMDEDDDSKAVADPNAGALGRYYGWPASRIVRVSRASGGKDRHSKVLTSKGLRDRRVRLSVNTAIQFYDLQDRLGYDQPSKAVEWLLKAAADSISELPPITTHFPDTPKQLSYEKRSFPGQLGVDSAELDVNSAEPGYQNQNQNNNSSNSEETSKGSGLSLSRSENRIKARERAKGRVMDNKDKEVTTTMHPVSSFTELLNGGMGNGSRNGSPNGQWGTTGIAGMEYYGLMGRNASMFSVSTEHQHQQQQFSFVPDHYVNNGEGNNGYNLNFSISNNNNNNGNQSTGSSSAALAGFNRGTLQSNSSPSSLLPNLHRFNPAAIDGSSQSFFTAPVENHHQYVPGFDGRLHLSYGDSDSGRHSRGKGKN